MVSIKAAPSMSASGSRHLVVDAVTETRPLLVVMPLPLEEERDEIVMGAVLMCGTGQGRPRGERSAGSTKGSAGLDTGNAD